MRLDRPSGFHPEVRYLGRMLTAKSASARTIEPDVAIPPIAGEDKPIW